MWKINTTKSLCNLSKAIHSWLLSECQVLRLNFKKAFYSFMTSKVMACHLFLVGSNMCWFFQGPALEKSIHRKEKPISHLLSPSSHHNILVFTRTSTSYTEAFFNFILFYYFISSIATHLNK